MLSLRLVNGQYTMLLDMTKIYGILVLALIICHASEIHAGIPVARKRNGMYKTYMQNIFLYEN